jgi:hypothetical protein
MFPTLLNVANARQENRSPIKSGVTDFRRLTFPLDY